ncbi:hypothetical protein [Amycolatopsis sp. A1MSW2902]|uniref:hypothetical protein n=1 Tax=Amycolatopsis sp. A1MSW2902 TaxID=687413 RepID=UPI00307D4A7F
MKKSTAVHVKGTANSGGDIKIDLQLNKDSVGDKIWMRFSKSLTKKAGLPAKAAAMVNDKWVSLDSGPGS